MSLDIYLTDKRSKTKIYQNNGIFVRDGGQTKSISREEWDMKFPEIEPIEVEKSCEDDDEVFGVNITHNLNKMASEVRLSEIGEGVTLYQVMWRPDEMEPPISIAGELTPYLIGGVMKLRKHADFYKQFNPENGWGDYEVLLKVASQYLIACVYYPEAKITIWR